jgi:DNA-binding MarR family transcriptional regulator
VDALDLIMLGRQLTKIGEEVMRGSKTQTSKTPTAGEPLEAPFMPTGPSLVLRDVFANPGSSITDITARTGLPQSYVSESVARLRGQGIVQTSADPADGRRTLVRVSAQHPRTVAAKGTATVDAALAAALGEPDGGAAVTKIIGTLKALADQLAPETPGPIRRQLDQARREQLDQARREQLDQGRREQLDQARQEQLDQARQEQLDQARREQLDQARREV